MLDSPRELCLCLLGLDMLEFDEKVNLSVWEKKCEIGERRKVGEGMDMEVVRREKIRVWRG